MTLQDRLQQLASDGYCPALLYDDNGHWALVFDGFQNCPMGAAPCDINTTFYVEADDWAETIDEAVSRCIAKATANAGGAE